MAKRIKVKLQDTVPPRVIFIDPDASAGATLGTNLFTPDGAIGTPASVREWLDAAQAQEVRERPPASGGVTHHRLLQGLSIGDDHVQYPLFSRTVAPRSGDLIIHDGTTFVSMSPRNCIRVFNDFTFESGLTGEDGWDASVTGTGSSKVGVREAGSPGILRLVSGTSASANAGVLYGLNCQVAAVTGLSLGDGEIWYRCRMKWVGATLPSNSGAGNMYLMLGLVDEVQAAPGNGLFVTTDAQASGGAYEGEWVAAAATTAGGIVLSQDVAIPITTDTWHLVAINVSADGGTVRYYIDGVLFATVTSNLPTNLALTFGAQMRRTTSAGTSYTIYVDYIEVFQFLTTLRE